MNITIQRTPRKSDADICRENGWTVGTLLAGCEGYGEDVIQLTAIGEKSILAKQISRIALDEGNWTLMCREWHKVEPGYVPKPAPARKPCDP